jgi:uncharacterized protein (TIGR02246 family)
MTTATTQPIAGDPATVANTILERAERAWNAADGAAFGALFAEESDFVNVRGEHHRGRDVIARGHQGIFHSIYAGSTVRYTLDLARPLEPGYAIAVASATLDVPGGPLRGVHRSRMTMVIAEHGGEWLVTAFHNTLVAA